MSFFSKKGTMALICFTIPLHAMPVVRHRTKSAITDNNIRSRTLHLEQKDAKATATQPSIYFINDEQQESSYEQYLKACYLHARGKAPDAFKAYQHVLEQAHSPYAYGGFFHLLFDIGQFKSIVALYERKANILEAAFKNNLELQLIIAQAYLNTDQEAKAERLFTSLAEKYPDNAQVAYYKAVSFIQNKELDKALVFIDDCLQKPILHAKHFLFYFLKSKIYLAQNQATQALAMIEKSLHLFPRFDRGWLFKSILLEQQGKINDAIAGYKKFLDLVGSEEMIEKQLIQLLFAQKRYEEAAHYLKKMKSNRPEHQFDMALIEFKAGNYDKALQHVNTSLAKAPSFKQAKLLKVEVLLAQKKSPEALAFLQAWLEENPQDNFVIHTILLLRKSGVPITELIKTIESVNKKATPSFGLLSALADLCIEHGDYKKGIVYYKSIFSLTTNQELKSKILYHIAYILFTIKEYTHLDNFIPKALAFKPTSPNLYNLIAFYYVQTNQKLPQALELIEQALATERHSPYYLDTKGLILIKMGKKDEAQEVLKEAQAIAPHDTVIAEHMKLTKEK